MRKLILIIFASILLPACNPEENQGQISKGSNNTFTTTSYNYTKHGLYFITFKDSSLPFKIDDAPFGGTVFFNNSSKLDLEDGTKVYYSANNCCFIWRDSFDNPKSIRVVWNVVYDTDYYYGRSSLQYDERSSKESAPGSRWCQTIINIQPSKDTDRPTMVFLHFLPDGTVQANLGTFKSGGPLTAEQVKTHSASLPEHQFCKQEIENPFYGIPRTPHRE